MLRHSPKAMNEHCFHASTATSPLGSCHSEAQWRTHKGDQISASLWSASEHRWRSIKLHRKYRKEWNPDLRCPNPFLTLRKQNFASNTLMLSTQVSSGIKDLWISGGLKKTGQRKEAWDGWVNVLSDSLQNLFLSHLPPSWDHIQVRKTYWLNTAGEHFNSRVQKHEVQSHEPPQG